MKARHAAAVAVVLAAALAGCSASSSSPTASSSTPAPAATSCAARTRLAHPAYTQAQVAALCASAGSSSGPPTAVTVAQRLGATDVSPIKPSRYAYDEATAQLDGEEVDIATFTSNSLRDSWVAIADFSDITTGDRYAVENLFPASEVPTQ